MPSSEEPGVDIPTSFKSSSFAAAILASALAFVKYRLVDPSVRLSVVLVPNLVSNLAFV